MSSCFSARLLAMSVVTVTLGLVAALSALAFTASVDVVQLLAARTQSVKRHDGGIAVLLPTTMAIERAVYNASSASENGYALEIDGSEPCNGANVCLEARFTAQRGAKRYGAAIRLSHGFEGSFANIQCGATCSPASIDWIEHGVLYTIEANPSIESQANISTTAFEQVFVAAADQAIDAGAR